MAAEPHSMPSWGRALGGKELGETRLQPRSYRGQPFGGSEGQLRRGRALVCHCGRLLPRFCPGLGFIPSASSFLSLRASSVTPSPSPGGSQVWGVTQVCLWVWDQRGRLHAPGSEGIGAVPGECQSAAAFLPAPAQGRVFSSLQMVLEKLLGDLGGKTPPLPLALV